MLAALLPSPALGFSSPEHKDSGDKGAALALSSLRREVRTPFSGKSGVRATAKGGVEVMVSDGKSALGWMSVGDLVGIYGDYRGGVEELNHPSQKSRIAALKRIVATGDLKKEPAEEKKVIELATVNVTHFGATAMRTYVKWHTHALTLARDPRQAWRALHYEALALHSLTDLFALGHLLVSRADVEKWLRDVAAREQAAARKKSPAAPAVSFWKDPLQYLKSRVSKAAAFLKEKLDWAKAKIDEFRAKYVAGVFANFYHNGYNYYGGKVRNLNGDAWTAYGDYRYRYVVNGKDLAVRQQAVMKMAVAVSVLAVLRAMHGRRVGSANAALRFVPISYRDARTCEDPVNQPGWIAYALIRQNVNVLKDYGLKPEFLKAKRVPDGTVPFLPELRRLCGAGCPAK